MRSTTNARHHADCQTDRQATRPTFLAQSCAAGSLAGLGLWTRMCHAEPAATLVQAGHAAVDTTPPLGVELAGFHRPPGQERLATGIRQPTAARALMLKHGETAVVLVSLDIIGYLPDPNAYQAGEYAALTVPGLLDLPPFTPQAAQRLAEQALQLLAKIA